jgi:hypothetical protein
MHKLSSDDKQRSLAGAMLKGCVAAIPEAAPTKPAQQPSEQDRLREVVRKKLRQQVAAKVT